MVSFVNAPPRFLSCCALVSNTAALKIMTVITSTFGFHTVVDLSSFTPFVFARLTSSQTAFSYSADGVLVVKLSSIIGACGDVAMLYLPPPQPQDYSLYPPPIVPSSHTLTHQSVHPTPLYLTITIHYQTLKHKKPACARYL